MLPPATDKLWDFLRALPSLRGFVLIGGSALAMHIRHRLSEDLDFAWVSNRLPREQIDALLTAARQAGFDFVRDDNQHAYEEFLIAGMELHNYQQNFLVDGVVKVTFFTTDQEVDRVLGGAPAPEFRVATVEELFRMKSLVAAYRSASRDWFDLYTLIREHGFSLRAMREVFLRFDHAQNWDIALSRLCSGQPREGDPGIATLMANPPTVEELRDFFRAERDKFETELAAEARAGQLRG